MSIEFKSFYSVGGSTKYETNTAVEAWRELLETSKEQPFILLKFSITCTSSPLAMKELRALDKELPKYVVIVQTDREVSNAMEQDFGVRHESPQLLILKDGEGIWQATHFKIKRSLLTEVIATYVV